MPSTGWCRWALRLGATMHSIVADVSAATSAAACFFHCRPLLILLFWLLLLASTPSLMAMASVIGTKRLYCMSCVREETDTTVLDQFRVRQGLPVPMCEMEPVECEPHQDTCVTISMQMAHRQFWMGSGCDQRVNYDFPSGGRDGCVELPAIYRNFHPGFMEQRRTLQRLCLCSGNLCNSASIPSGTIVGLFLPPKCHPLLHSCGLLLIIAITCIAIQPHLLLLLS